MAENAHIALILECISEINAHLRVLDEANARLEAAVEHQLELLEILVSRQGHIAQQSISQNRSELGRGSRMADMPVNRIIDRDHEYTRETHPALFKVVDLLEQNEHTRGLSVRQLAHETGVSKSWCAIAKHHTLSEESVH